MKWSVGRILYVTMLMCILLGISVTFRSTHAVHLGLILYSLAVASVGACYSRRWRKQLLAYSVFGWSYLAIIIFDWVEGEPSEFPYLFFSLGLLTVLTVGLIPTDA